MSKLFNPMSIADVRVDTMVHISRSTYTRGRGKNTRKVTDGIVYAIKPCGCEGPSIGVIERIDNLDDLSVQARAKLPEPPEGRRAKLWKVMPQSHTHTEYVYGMDDAATRLRDWWATRNIQRVLRRSEEHSRAVGGGAGR